MLGLICLAWLHLRKLKLQCGGKYHPSEKHVEGVMRTSAVSTRRWPRFPVDLPVHVVVRNGMESLKVPGRGTELGLGGMALYAGLTLQPGDPIERDRVPGTVPLASRWHYSQSHCLLLRTRVPLPASILRE